MTGTIIALSIAYAVAFGVATVLAIGSRWPLWLRAGLVLAMTGLIFVTYRSIGDLRGLPTDDPPPGRFRLHWAEIREPDKARGDPGSIFLWLSELDEDWYIVGTPRAHQVPWTPELAQSVSEAMQAVAEGQEIAGEISERVEITDTAERLAAEIVAEIGAGEGGSGQLGERFLNMDFGDLSFGEAPAPVTPAKQGS